MSRFPDVPACQCSSCVAKRSTNTKGMKKLHDDRRDAEVCICHGTRDVYRGGRCRESWEKKLKGERDRYATRKGRSPTEGVL